MDLAELLALWPTQRDPALADAIDLVSGRARVEPFVGSVQERIAAWTLASAQPDQLARVLSQFPIGGIAQGLEQLERLASADDPRVATRLIACLEDPPYRSPAALEFWRRAIQIIEALRDPRAIAALAHQAKRAQAEFAPPMGRLVERELLAALGRMKTTLRNVEPAPEHAALLARLRPRLRGDRQADELLAEIHERPEDDAPRLVYADYLAQRGDPRGEFINLQINEARGQATRESKRREKELLERHGLTWLGDLQPVINKTGLKYRRGFPDSVVFSANNEAQVEKLMGHPAWATIRSLTMDGHWRFQSRVDAMILDPVFRSLRELHGYTSFELLRALGSSATPRAITTLEFNQLRMTPSIGWSQHTGYGVMPPEGPKVFVDHQVALTDCPGLPDLRDLTLHWLFRVDAKFMRWLFFGPMGVKLERFATRVGAAFLPSYMRELAEHGLALFQTQDDDDAALYTLTRGPSGRLDQLEVVFRRTNRERWDGTRKPCAFADFTSMLEGLAPDELATLELRWPKQKAPTQAQLDELARILAARPQLEARLP